MQALKSGMFFGSTNKVTRLNGVTLSATEYTLPRVDWHYHENAYFTFLVTGKMIEGNKREAYHCSPGTLLFHNWQEPHYNIKPEGYTFGFHVEIQKQWFERFSFDIADVQGSLNIIDPQTTALFETMYRETQLDDSSSPETIHALLLESFLRISEKSTVRTNKAPAWVKKVKNLLHDAATEKITLDYLAAELQIHPVHICRDFRKHFGCTFGEYLRKRRIEHALALLPNKYRSLTDIAFECGFADQSHFIRRFKQLCGICPLQYRKMLN